MKNNIILGLTLLPYLIFFTFSVSSEGSISANFNAQNIKFILFLLILIFHLGYISLYSNKVLNKQSDLSILKNNVKEIYLTGLKSLLGIGTYSFILFCMGTLLLYIPFFSNNIKIILLLILSLVYFAYLIAADISFCDDLNINSWFNFEKIRKVITENSKNFIKFLFKWFLNIVLFLIVAIILALVCSLIAVFVKPFGIFVLYLGAFIIVLFNFYIVVKMAKSKSTFLNDNKQ